MELRINLFPEAIQHLVESPKNQLDEFLKTNI